LRLCLQPADQILISHGRTAIRMVAPRPTGVVASGVVAVLIVVGCV
jgi:hypothetical protein